MPTVKRQQQFRNYLIQQGVGKNDTAQGDSVNSYLSYIKSVANHSEMDVTPESLKSEDDTKMFITELSRSGKLSKKSISNCVSAMRQYVGMVNV